MTDALYHQQILDRAREATGGGRLAAPDRSARVDNPVCGDRVTIDLALRDGMVTAVGHEVRGCVLCQAAAAVIAAAAPGRTSGELKDAAAAVERMMHQGGSVPEGWPDLAMFLPVQAVRSRQDCVYLPFEALGKALARA